MKDHELKFGVFVLQKLLRQFYCQRLRTRYHHIKKYDTSNRVFYIYYHPVKQMNLLWARHPAISKRFLNWAVTCSLSSFLWHRRPPYGQTHPSQRWHLWVHHLQGQRHQGPDCVWATQTHMLTPPGPCYRPGTFSPDELCKHLCLCCNINGLFPPQSSMGSGSSSSAAVPTPFQSAGSYGLFNRAPVPAYSQFSASPLVSPQFGAVGVGKHVVIRHI